MQLIFFFFLLNKNVQKSCLFKHYFLFILCVRSCLSLSLVSLNGHVYLCHFIQDSLPMAYRHYKTNAKNNHVLFVENFSVYSSFEVFMLNWKNLNITFFSFVNFCLLLLKHAFSH